MSKFNTAQAIIEALQTEEGKNSFVSEWDVIPRKTDKSLRNSLRYKVLEAYFNEPEGPYGDVIEKMIENNIPLRRYENPIYALSDDERINTETEEFYLLLADKQVLYQGRNQNLENLENAVNIYNKYPRVVGRNIEAELLLSTYLNDKMDDFYSIVKSGKSLPYSSPSTVALFMNIVDNNDTDAIDKMIDANPEYMKNLGKVPFKIYKRAFPKNVVSYQSSSSYSNDYLLKENILRYSQEHGQYEAFEYLLNKNEELGISLDGAIVSWQADLLKKDKPDWERSRYNIYKTQNEKYSRDTFYKNVHTSLMFELFSEHLDSGKDELPQYTQNYLNKIIENGLFLTYSEDYIKTWSSKEDGKLDLNTSRIKNNIMDGHAKARYVLLYLKETKDYIFENSGRILKNEPDQEKKYNFFNDLIEYSNKKNHYLYNNTPKNPKWSFGFNKDKENDLISVITKNSIYFPKKYKETSSIRTLKTLGLTTLEEDTLSKQESLCVFETLVDFRENSQISKPKYFLGENNFNTPEQFKTLMTKDLTNGGHKNPLEDFIYSDCVAKVKYYDKDTLYFLHDEERKKTLYKNVDKFIKKLEKDNSLFIPMQGYKLNSFDQEIKSSLFPEAILSKGLGANIFTHLVTENQIRKFLNPTLLSDIEYDCDISERTLKNLYMAINRDLFLNDSVKIESHTQLKYEDVIRKLNNIDFKFKVDPSNSEQALCFVKMFTLIKDENLLEDMFNKNKDNFLDCIRNNIEFSNGNKDYLLNFSQNKKLLSLFSESINVKQLEKLFQETNSAETYKNFLKQTEFPLFSNEHNLLIEAIQNKKYKIANLLIDLNPTLSNITSKNHRLPLDYAIKDRNTFNDRKSTYFSLEDKQDCESFVLKIISNNVHTPVNSKKALENLAVRIGKESYFNSKENVILSKYLIDLNMETAAHNNQTKGKKNTNGKNKFTPSDIPEQFDDEDTNDVTFKI